MNATNEPITVAATRPLGSKSLGPVFGIVGDGEADGFDEGDGDGVLLG